MQHFGWRLESLGYDLFVGLLRLLPVDWASDFGAWLMKWMGPMTKIKRIVDRNLELAFPEKDAAWKAEISMAQWDNLGRTFFEFALMDRITIKNKRVTVENIERLEAIARENTPVVFVSGHFSNFEVMPATIMASGVSCQMTYRAANNPYIDARICAGRARYGVVAFAPKGSDGAKEILAGMSRGDSVALMNDQKFNRGVKTPFFGQMVDTAPGPARLAQRFGTVLQPMTIERGHKARFHVRVHEPIAVIDTGHRAADLEATVCHISQFIENEVRLRPADWFWVHKRWPDEAYR